MESTSSNSMDKIISLLLEPVPTLQQLASFVIAFRLSHRELAPEERYQYSNEISSYGDGKYEFDPSFVVSSSEHLTVQTVPSRIKEMIKTSANCMKIEINRWVDTLTFPYGIIPFFYDTDMDYRAYSRYCIWQQNCKIDDKKTAQNLCSSKIDGRMEIFWFQKKQFAIMCMYCLKDSIDEMPLDVLPKSSIEPERFRSSSLLDYWILYKRNELHKIPLQGFSTLDELMFCNALQPSYTWSALEYFWDRLDVENQTIAAQQLIRSAKAWRSDEWPSFPFPLKRLLVKMTELQRQVLLVSIPCDIIKKFWLEFNEFEIAHAIWIYVKDNISEKEYARLIRALTFSPGTYRDDIMNLLADIWNLAADHLKKYIFEHTLDEFLMQFSLPRYDSLPINSQFLCCMLSDASMDFKKDLFSKHGLDYLSMMKKWEDENDLD